MEGDNGYHESKPLSMLSLPSLVPRPSHVFQCFTRKKSFSCETLKNMGRPGYEANPYLASSLGYRHIARFSMLHIEVLKAGNVADPTLY